MSIRQLIPQFNKALAQQAKQLEHNSILFDIYEGRLLKYIVADLEKQLSKNSFSQVLQRIAPINVLRRIVDKLSKIYMESPNRRVEGGNEKDAELLSWFVEEMKVDRKMNVGNEFFNLFKNCLLQPLLDPDAKKPILRIIPSNMFVPFTTNRVDPTKPTHYLTVEDKFLNADGSETQIFGAYSKDEWCLFDAEDQVRVDIMATYGEEAASGINPYGVLPFVYVNRSENLLIPLPDDDALQMSKVIPIVLSDLNFAVMYQCFSIVYGINVDDQNITMSPNAFWSFQSKGDGELKPEIGVIKPQVDIVPVLSLIQAQLSFWLQTRGIRPGSIGTLQADQSASGISKIVDEMDTSEDRKKQVNWFAQAETELWDLILKYMHPVWVRNGLVEQRYIFTPTAEVEVTFPEQLPLADRGSLVTSSKDEVAAGFTTRRRAIERLNPGMDEEQIDKLMDEIALERFVGVVTTPESGGAVGELGQEGAPDEEDEEGETEET